MRPLEESFDEGQALPIDGLMVEETSDEDTVRQFMSAWRRRLSREYAAALLRQRPGQEELRSSH